MSWHIPTFHSVKCKHYRTRVIFVIRFRNSLKTQTKNLTFACQRFFPNSTICVLVIIGSRYSTPITFELIKINSRFWIVIEFSIHGYCKICVTVSCHAAMITPFQGWRQTDSEAHSDACEKA